MAKKKTNKSKGVVDADGKRWYNSIDPGIDTSWGSAIYNGPGILFRLVTGVKRDEFSPEYEENLWKAYTMGGTEGLPKSDVRFDGEDLGDADVVGLPQEQAVIVQSIADTLYAKQIRDKVRNKMYSSPGEDEAMRREAIEYQDVAEKILNSPGEWVSIREGSSPVREFKKVGKREVGFTGLGGLKNFDVRWNPEESTLDVRDEYDFKEEGVEGNIPRRDRRLFIRDRIKFYPEKGGVFYRNPKKVDEMGYRSRFEEGGIVGLKPEDGISLYYVPVMYDGGGVLNELDERLFRRWYDHISKKKGLDPDPDGKDHYYDYRSFWKNEPELASKMMYGNAEAHFTDKYKLPGHPTFSDESIYSNEDTPGGRWIEHDGIMYYEPSSYTKNYFNRTKRYLSGSGEGVVEEFNSGDKRYVLIPEREINSGLLYKDKNGSLRSDKNMPAIFEYENKSSKWKDSDIDWDLFEKNYHNFNRYGGGYGRIVHKDNMNFIYNELVKRGYYGNRLYTILANIVEESGGDPFSKNGEHYGLFRESEERYPDRLRKRDSKLSEKDAIVSILNRVVPEIEGTSRYTSGGDGSGYFTGKDAHDSFWDDSANLEDVSRAFLYGFERPSDKQGTFINRTNVAKIIKQMAESGRDNSFEEVVGNSRKILEVPIVFDEGGNVYVRPYYASRDNTSVGGPGIDANANYGQRISPQFNIGEAIAGVLPVIGDAIDVKDLIESYSNKDWMGMGLAAAGFIPIGGDLLQEYIRLKKAKFLEEIPVRSERRTSGMGLRGDIKESDEELIEAMPSYAKPNSPMSGASVSHISRLDKGAYERITGRLRDDFIRNARDLEQLYPGIYKRVFNVDKSDIDDGDLTNLLEMFYFKKKGEFSNMSKEDKMDMLDKIRSKIFEDSPMYKIGNDGDNAIVYSEDAYSTLFPDDKNKEGINVGVSHELDHAVQSNASKEFLKELSDSSNEWFDDSRLNDEWRGVFENRIELAARGSQIKDYFGLTDDSQKITPDMLKYAARHYTEDNWINNNMSEFFQGIKDWDKAADWITKYSTVTIPAAAIPYFVEEGERAQRDEDEFNKKYKAGGKIGSSISDTGFSYYYGYKPFYNIKNFNTRRNYVRSKLIDEYGFHEWDADDALNDIIPKSMLDDSYYDVKNNTYGIGQWGGADLKRFKALYDKGGLDDQIDFLAKEYKKKNGGSINNMDDLYRYLRGMHVKKEGGLVEKQDELYSTLTEDYGMKPIQAIAVIANLTHESNLDETILGDSGASLGLQQWKGERRDALESFAFAKGHPVPTFDDQIEFLMNEYNSGQAFQFDYKGQNLYAAGKTKNPTFDYYQYSKSDFEGAKNLYDAVIAWNQGVGRPSKKYAYNDRRYNIAKKIADRHGIKYSNKSYFGEMGMNPEWVDIDVSFVPVVTGNSLSATGGNSVSVDDSVGTTSSAYNSGNTDPAASGSSGEPVLSGEELFMQQYGNAIVQQMLAADMKYTRMNDQSSELAKRQEEIASDARKESESIRVSEQQRREREFLASILPSIQLNVKGVSRN